MSDVMTMRAVPDRSPEGAPAPVTHVIDVAGGPGPGQVFAYVERELPTGGVPAYRAARSSGARSFVLWADPDRREQLARVVTVSADGGVAAFQVLGAHGEMLGTVVREKALRGKGWRTRWTVVPPGGPEAVGFKGRIGWWCMWWLLLPLQVFILVFTVLDGTPNNEGGVARGPRRIRWRAGGQLPLEFRSRGDRLHLHAPGFDRRFGAALIALLRSFNTGAWDDRKK